MSQTARIPDLPEMPEDRGTSDVQPDAESVPLLSPDKELPRASEPASTSSRAMDFVSESLSEIGEACRPFYENSAEWMRGVGRSVKRMKEEKPLQFLSVIAGAAFALGVATRIWKESHE